MNEFLLINEKNGFGHLAIPFVLLPDSTHFLFTGIGSASDTTYRAGCMLGERSSCDLTGRCGINSVPLVI
jgi:hypothetical protein